MNKEHQGYALITGASSGIGLAIANELAKKHYNLILVARNETRLKEVANEIQARYDIHIKIIILDLSQTGAAQALLSSIGPEIEHLEILVNNAGFGAHGLFEEIDFQTIQQMMRLNMNTLAELTHLCLPAMKAVGKGEIINIASVVSFLPCPNFAIYAATKAFVLSFSEALHLELAGTGVNCIAICPGSTDTQFHNTAGTSHLGSTQRKDSATDVAQMALAASRSGKFSIITGWRNKAIPFVVRLLPRYVMGKIAQKLFKVK